MVYISHRTPFVSAVKRVRKLLALADKRAVQSKTSHIAKDDPRRVDKVAKAVAAGSRGEEEEEVWVKATGKSIQKALQLAVFFQQQEDLKVRLRSGSLWAVDDIVPGDDSGDVGGEEEEDELPETRMRQTSLLEVAVSLR